jgi:hypothetical protein
VDTVGAESRGHAAARRFLIAFAVTGAVFLLIARWWDPLGRAPWLMVVGVVAGIVAASLGLVALILYAAMFAARRSERKS